MTTPPLGDWYTYLLLGALALAGTIPFWVYLRQPARQRDLLEPVYAAAVYFVVLFVIRAVFDMTLGGPYLGLPPWDQRTVAAFDLALVYLIPSLLVFLLGYYLPWGRDLVRRFPRVPASWDDQRFQLIAPIALVIGLLSVVALVESLGGLAYYISHKQQALTAGGQGYLTLGVSVLALVFGVSLSRLLKSGKGKLVTIGILLPTLLVIGFFSGSKGEFLTPIVLALVLWHYLKRRINLRIIGTFLLLAVLIFPIFNAYRAVNDISRIGEVLSQSSSAGSADFLIRNAINRFYGIDALTYAVRDTPRVMDFQYGATIAPLVYAWVPRQLWPDKPTISFGKVFSDTYFASVFYGTGTSSSPTILGEGYINFHVPGMLLFALLGGLMLRAAYEYLVRQNFGAPAVFVYGFIFARLFTFWEADVIGLLAYGAAAFAVAWLATALMGTTRSSRVTTRLTRATERG